MRQNDIINGGHCIAKLMTDAADQARAAQRVGQWSQAAAHWRQAADMCDEKRQHHDYLKQAAWCEDMNTLRQEYQ